MFWLELVLVVAGFAVLVVGFRRNNRNILLAAGIVLFLSGALPDFVRGVEAGYSGSGIERAASQDE